MLVIRSGQLEALERIPRLEYENSLLRHFERFYPLVCALAGRDQVRKLVRHGIDHGMAHGFQSQREIAFYVNLMVILGCDFDHDPQYAWAGEQLNDLSIADPFARIQRVFRTTADYLGKTSGAGNEHVFRALDRMRRYDLETVPESYGAQRENDFLSVLQSFYPEKYACHTRAELLAVIRCGAEAASNHGLHEAGGQAFYMKLLFVFGVGFDRDPLYPWVGRALVDPTLRGERARAEGLHREAVAYIDSMLPVS